MRPEDRFEFSALPQRPRRELPDGKRMAVYCVVNVEEWDIEKPVAREYVSSPAGVMTVPNVPNWELGLARVRHACRLLAYPRFPEG
jgi:hypothetical protein